MYKHNNVHFLRSREQARDNSRIRMKNTKEIASEKVSSYYNFFTYYK